MTRDDFINQIKRHEGCRDHVYLDSVGIPTGGWGHAFLVGSKIPDPAAEAFLRHDLQVVEVEYYQLELYIFDPVRIYVIKNMLFNLGLPKLKMFTKFLNAIRSGDWDRAADEMLDSRWARQVGNRAIELSEQMRTGIYQGEVETWNRKMTPNWLKDLNRR